MTFRFTVLASGSSGNCSFLDAGGFGVLLDLGLGPRLLASRLGAVGVSLHDVHAALLTHTHSDHWNERTFVHLARRNVPLYCHDGHALAFRSSVGFAQLRANNLVRTYAAQHEWSLAPALRCRSLPISHDTEHTFGFRLEGSSDLFGQPFALAYAADLGTWTAELVEQLADVDLLALEFNHDVGLEKNSGRSEHLIARVLGDRGHLSNVQAAELLGEVLRRSPAGRMRHLVQLHLSRECNRRYLAADAAHAVVASHTPAIEVHTAHQDRPTPFLTLGQNAKRGRLNAAHPCPTRANRAASLAGMGQSWLPGLET